MEQFQVAEDKKEVELIQVSLVTDGCYGERYATHHAHANVGSFGEYQTAEQDWQA